MYRGEGKQRVWTIVYPNPEGWGDVFASALFS